MTRGKHTHDPRDDERASEATSIDPELVEDLGAQLGARDRDEELARAVEEAARNLETAQRWQAEFENFRRRQERAADEQRARASERIVTDLLPAVDDLERAIAHAKASAESGGELDQLLTGVEMVHGRLTTLLAREGVSVLDPSGERFDANVHQAVGQREDASVPEHTVVEVYQRGYLMGERVLRPAMVVVATGGPDA